MNTKLKNPKLLAPILVVVLIVIGVIGYQLFFNKPSKADYEAANDQLTTAIKTRTGMNEPYGTYIDAIETAYSSKSKAAAAADVKDEQVAFTEQYNKYRDQVNNLGSAKAFRNSDAKQAYDDFKTQEDNRLKFISAYIDGYAQINYAINQSCLDITPSGSQNDYATSVQAASKAYAKNTREMSKQCISDYEKLSKSSNKPMATLANDNLAAIKAYLTALDAIVGYGDDTNAVFADSKTASDEFIAAREKAFTTYSADEKAALAANFKDTKRSNLVTVLDRLTNQN